MWYNVYMSNFANNLKELRTKKGLLQKELGKLLFVSSATVSGWEVGRNRPSYNLLVKLARILDTSVDYLIGNVDDFGNLIPLNDDTDGEST